MSFPMEDDQEYLSLVTEILPYGLEVEIDKAVGFTDQAKHSSRRSDEPTPTRGDQLRVVVLDSSRTPPRLSALGKDARIAKERRSRE